MNDIKYWSALENSRIELEKWNERRKMAEQNAMERFNKLRETFRNQKAMNESKPKP